MPFTGACEINQHGKAKVYAAAVDGPPEWVKVPTGFGGGTHVDFKPQLGVRIRLLKNHNTPPRKCLVAGKIPAHTWEGVYWMPKGRGKLLGIDVDWSAAGPKPTGKGWGKGLEEVY